MDTCSYLRCLESRFAVRSASNCHRFAAISNRTIRTARPKTIRIAVTALLFSLLNFQCKNLMYSKNGVVYKLHAGWFINRAPGEFINSGLFIKFKGLLCGNPTERGESLTLNFWPRGSLQVQPRHRDCLPQARGIRTGKMQYVKYLYCQFISK